MRGRLLPARAEVWNARYRRLATLLAADPAIRLPSRPIGEGAVASSIQFSVTGRNTTEMHAWLDLAARHGVPVKWFGAPEPRGFTSRFDHWRFADEQPLNTTGAVLAALCDMRIPLSMSPADCETIATIIRGALARTAP